MKRDQLASALPDVDSPFVNALRNNALRDVILPVVLLANEREVARGDVTLPASSQDLKGVALSFFLRELQRKTRIPAWTHVRIGAQIEPMKKADAMLGVRAGLAAYIAKNPRLTLKKGVARASRLFNDMAGFGAVGHAQITAIFLPVLAGLVNAHHMVRIEHPKPGHWLKIRIFSYS